jgi:hypothetical protein
MISFFVPFTLAMSRTARAVPRTVPVTFDRPVRARYSTGTSVIRQPASAARTTISRGHPNRRSWIPRSSRVSRRAARIGPRSRRWMPVRRRTSRAMTRFPSRACSGQAPGSGRRSPSMRSTSPATTGPATSGSSWGSSEPSQSMKQTTSSAAAWRPAKQAAPNPCFGSRTTKAPRSSAMSAESSADPLSTTIGA